MFRTKYIEFEKVPNLDFDPFGKQDFFFDMKVVASGGGGATDRRETSVHEEQKHDWVIQLPTASSSGEAHIMLRIAKDIGDLRDNPHQRTDTEKIRIHDFRFNYNGSGVVTDESNGFRTTLTYETD